MLHPRSPARRPRRGMVAVQVTLCLSVLLGICALAVDCGILYAERRHAQATADAAALAAAIDLFSNYQSNPTPGLDYNGRATASGKAVGNANGYTNVSIHIPPSSGPYAGKPGYAEATVQFDQQRLFSGIFGSGTFPVTARAVARGDWVIPSDGILVLDPTSQASFKITGGGTINVSGGGIIVDSNSGSALTNSGGGTINATDAGVVGGYTGGGTYNIPGGIQTGVPPTPDPFWYYPTPTAPPAAPASTVINMLKGNGKVNSAWTNTIVPKINALVAAGQMTNAAAAPYLSTTGNTNYTATILSPGTYTSAIKFTNSTDLVFFQQASAGNGGIYYLDKGITANNATLVMDPSTTGGMMFYNNPSTNADGISISGSSSGTVYLAGLDGTVTSTAVYKGMLIFQRRDSTVNVSITGDGSFTMLGTFYAASAELDVTGNGSLSIIGAQYVSNTLKTAGNGIVNIAYSSRRVPSQRFIYLVE